VFADVQDNMKIAQEEIFGPVMTILKFKDLDEVVTAPTRACMDSQRPVWTKDITRRNAIADRVRAGNGVGKCYDVSTRERRSEATSSRVIGRELGEYGLANYTEVKTVTIKL